MTNPTADSIRAALHLCSHHADDEAVFYASEDGESAVVVVSDPDFIEVLMVLMNFVEAKQKGPSEDEPFVITPTGDLEA
jgi:hypothetical protein